MLGGAFGVAGFLVGTFGAGEADPAFRQGLPGRRIGVGPVGQDRFGPGARPSTLFPADTDPLQRRHQLRVVPVLAGSQDEAHRLVTSHCSGGAGSTSSAGDGDGKARAGALWHDGLDNSIGRSRRSAQQRIQQGQEPRADGFQSREGDCPQVLVITVRAWLDRICRRSLCQFDDQGRSLEPGRQQQGEEDLHLAAVEHAAGDKSLAQEVAL